MPYCFFLRRDGKHIFIDVNYLIQHANIELLVDALDIEDFLAVEEVGLIVVVETNHLPTSKPLKDIVQQQDSDSIRFLKYTATDHLFVYNIFNTL